MSNDSLATLAVCATLFGYGVQWMRSLHYLNNTWINVLVVIMGAFFYAWAHSFHLEWQIPLTYLTAFQWITSIRGTAALAHDVKAAPASSPTPPKP